MENLQLLLAGGKGNTTDLTVFLSASEHSLFVYLGLALLERVDDNPNLFAYKMLVGRLVNAGMTLEELRRKFNHDPRTMKTWAKALMSNDPDMIVRAFSGRGSLPKIIDPIVRMVKMRYLQLRRTVRNYRQVIAGEIKECFGVTVSRETLRRLFAMAREENETAASNVNNSGQRDCPEITAAPSDEMADEVPVDSVQLMAIPCLSKDNLCLDKAVNDNHSPDSAPLKSLSLPNSETENIADSEVTEDSLSIDSEVGDKRNKGDLPNANESKQIGTDKSDDSLLSETLPDVLPPVNGLPYSGQVVGTQVRAIHHAGQILFSPWLDLIGTQRDQAFGLQSQWIGQILQGAVNIEQSHLICDSSLSFFTGPVIPGLQAQRTHLGEMAAPEAVLEVYKANTHLLPDGPGIGKVFLYDPHTKDCSTQLDILKGWCGKRHGIAKVLHLDFIHTESGFPCFLQHYDNYYDLRERFFITLSMFGQLFPGESPAGSTFVLDRGIYRQQIFSEFRHHGCDLITWEKGYSHDGWDASRSALVFQRYRERNHAGDLKKYTFECQESTWTKDPSIRRIIVRATNPNGRMIEVSILCSNPDMDMKHIVTLIFNRWIQENNFKYLDKHFGFLQITSYASERYSDIAHTLVDRLVESPDYRKLRGDFNDAEQTLAKLLLKNKHITKKLDAAKSQQQLVKQSIAGLEKCIDELIKNLKPHEKSLKLKHHRASLRKLRSQQKNLEKNAIKFEKQQNTAEQEIKAIDQQLAKLDADLDRELRQKSRLKILIEGNYQRLDIRKKAMLDTLRLTAHNMFQNLMHLFRPLYGNYRNDHVMLRMLTRTDGFIWSADNIIHIRLWLTGHYQPHHKKIFRSFIKRMNTLINKHFKGRASTVDIDIVDAATELSRLAQNESVEFVIPRP